MKELIKPKFPQKKIEITLPIEVFVDDYHDITYMDMSYFGKDVYITEVGMCDGQFVGLIYHKDQEEFVNALEHYYDELGKQENELKEFYYLRNKFEKEKAARDFELKRYEELKKKYDEQ